MLTGSDKPVASINGVVLHAKGEVLTIEELRG